MAQYLRLESKADGEIFIGRGLIKLDEQLCKYFDTIPHKLYWYKSWMDTVGLSLELGKSWDEIKAEYKGDPDMYEIVDYLADRFNNTSYASR